ncbi:hypothetical protein AVEN_164044-1 [Araneus ventricosus]|nr:hypothetical protein AVEN_164044-1 [Araneus ventricosus]
MNDLTLRDKCQVYIAKPRVPHIIIFDIPPQDGDQAAHENNFILKLKESNELTDQEIKVLFKKKGRRSLQKWILAMQPKNYQEIKDKKRLRCGFNSYRFKEFLEPLRCFCCYRFGHLKRNCRETKPTCTKCTTNHDPKGCTKPHPICRNCALCNKSTNLEVRTDHMSNSKLCPMYLREIEFIAKHTIYGQCAPGCFFLVSFCRQTWVVHVWRPKSCQTFVFRIKFQMCSFYNNRTSKKGKS